MSDVINLFGLPVIMFHGGAADRQSRLSQALVANGRVTMGKQFANFRAVHGDERGCVIEIRYFHSIVSIGDLNESSWLGNWLPSCCSTSPSWLPRAFSSAFKSFC